METHDQLNERIKLLQELVSYMETGRRLIPFSHLDEYELALASVSDRKTEEMDREAQRPL